MWLPLLLTLCAVATAVVAWDQQPDGYELIDGPQGRAAHDVDRWRMHWTEWKDMELLANRYDPEDVCNIYNMETAQWTQKNFVQAFLMLHDRDIYDRKTNSYTVDKYVANMERRVGKIDSVLLWPAYPNIGIDNRNQWDFVRDLPGGIAGIQQLIQQFHSHDIRVLLPYNPWDTATRDEDGLERVVRMYNADILTLNTILDELDADGFNGDTMYGVPKSFFNCSHPIVATPEGGVPTAYLSHNPISWGYFNGFTRFPPVARAKFLEPRHMVQVCARWSLDRTLELQMAFFNGVGYVVWENVWGIWNAMTAREDETAKRMFKILRFFAFTTSSSLWKPFYASESTPENIFVSEFPVPKQESWYYSMISTSDREITFQFSLTPSQSRDDVTVYDVYHGFPLTKQRDQLNCSFVQITVEPRGIGAIFASSQPVEGLDHFLNEMNDLTVRPLTDFSTKRPLLYQKFVPSSSDSSSFSRFDRDFIQSADKRGLEDEMIRIHGTQHWWFNVSGVQIEPVAAWTPTWPQLGTGVQFPWEHRPWNNHSTRLQIQDFYVDKYPVTNRAFCEFLHASKYQPKSLDRFLLHWENRQRTDGSSERYNPLSMWEVPRHLEDCPVVYVAWEDAVAFAAFYGKRLPHDWEWQYIASNGDQYDLYPWGNDFAASRLHSVSREKKPPSPDRVGSHSASRSTVFGVEDLVGYVWQMTDQTCDAHTCGLLLRGGSFYQPIASTHSDPNWYFPQAYQSNQHNRFLMLSESYDRSAFIGFRCVRSA